MTAHGLIIGGTRGMGHALASSWLQQGLSVSVVGRAPYARATHPALRTWAADIADTAKVGSVLQDVVAASGPIDRLVFCQRYRGSGDAWEGELSTSLTATRAVIEWAAHPDHQPHPSAIVVIGSIAAELVQLDQPLGYHVAKAGLAQLVRYYAVKLGALRMRINGVTSGPMVKPESRAFYATSPEGHRFAQLTPLGRMGTTDDLADVVDYLCSDKAGFITGQNIVVDGGLSLRWPGSVES
ncbi:MAG: SDR family oxidoreductase [Deltaproteobacteria bacterium]|nr:SDR family oxidoreductase [Deltaproteobacteria bacterium]